MHLGHVNMPATYNMGRGIRTVGMNGGEESECPDISGELKPPIKLNYISHQLIVGTSVHTVLLYFQYMNTYIPFDPDSKICLTQLYVFSHYF